MKQQFPGGAQTVIGSNQPAPGGGSQFQFNKTLFESAIFIRVRSQDREDFVKQLVIKLVIHAASTNQQTQILTL
jgi:hypothetical protein